MKLMRCVRVIEYIGPEDWLRETLQQSAVGPKGTRFKLGSDRQIAEIARTTKVLAEVRPVHGPVDPKELDAAYTHALGSVEDHK